MRTGLPALSLRMFALAVAAALPLCTSPSGPVADGGTHTGNPDVTACVAALYEAMETGDEWRVDYYIDAGRLDPATIDPQLTPQGLAKRCVSGMSVGSAKAQDTIVVVDTILKSDTLILERKTIHRDTIINPGELADTVDTALGGVPVRYVITSLVFDTIFSADTLVSYDTIFLVDTVLHERTYLADTIPATAPDTGDGAGENQRAADSVTIEMKDVTPLVNTSDFSYTGGTADTVRTKWVSSLSKSYVSPEGTVVLVRYGDADGNGRLYEAAPGGMPAALLTERRIAGGAGIELSCRFNAGADTSFSSVGNNMIDSLVRLHYTGELLDERVLFLGLRSTSNAVADKAVLSRFIPTDSIRYTKTTFTAAGERMTRLDHSRVFMGRVENVDSLGFHLEGFTKGKGEALTSASFEALLHLRDESVGRFAGTIDTSDGLVGTYRLNGAIYRVRARGPGSVTVEQVTEQ